MRLFTVARSQKIGLEIEKAWEFFRNPSNLKEITPDHLGFEITKDDLTEEIYQGLIISYRVKPILGLPMNWITEITEVSRPFSFIDEQRFGPYKFWHHRHTFQSIPGGTLIIDEVNYGLPLGMLGRLMNSILVKHQLKKIFDYRFEFLEQKFPYQEMQKAS